MGQRTSRRPPTRGSVGAEAGMDPGGTLHSPRRAALPQPPCCPAHAALYRSQIGSRTPRCQPDFQAAPRSHRTGFAADARRRGGRAWGPGCAGARRAPAAALFPRTRRTLQIPNRISHAQMPARFPRHSPPPGQVDNVYGCLQCVDGDVEMDAGARWVENGQVMFRRETQSQHWGQLDPQSACDDA